MPVMKAGMSLIGTPQSSNVLKSLPSVLTTNRERDSRSCSLPAHQVGSG